MFAARFPKYTPPSLGESAQMFLEEVARRLPEGAAVDDGKRGALKMAYMAAVSDTLRLRRFRNLSHGLRAMADAALETHGEHGIQQYIAAQTAISFDAAEARQTRQKLGPALDATVRRGQRELDTLDTAQAFALEHGLELLEGTIQATYEPPVVVDEATWSDSVKDGLRGAHAGTAGAADVERLGDSITQGLDAWQRVRAKPSVASLIRAFTQPATLGYRTSQFLARIRKALPEDPTAKDFADAVETQLKLRRFRPYEPGLRALARAAWEDYALKTNFICDVLARLPDVEPDLAKFDDAVAAVLSGPQFEAHAEMLSAVAKAFWEAPSTVELDCYLREQAELAADSDVRDHWNRDCRTKMGEILSTAVRAGKKEITTADAIQAFALDHGLEMLDATIKDRYVAPAVDDVGAWQKEVFARLRHDLKKLDPSEPDIDFAKVEAFTSGIASTFDAWKNLPEPERRTLMTKIGTLVHDLKDQPVDMLVDSLKTMKRRVDQVPTEAHLVTITATSLALLAKAGLGVMAMSTAPWMAVLAAGCLGTMVLAWASADLSGGTYHWAEDNLDLGRTAIAFQDHHYDPRAVSTWPLIRNAHGTARIATPLILAAAYAPMGVAAAKVLALIGVSANPVALGALAAVFAATYLNGIMYTQHIHGKAHAQPHEIASWERTLQELGVWLPPEVHANHHGKKGLGKQEFGVLNGMTNSVTDKVGYYRLLDAIGELVTGKEVGWKREPELRAAAMKRKKKGYRPVVGCGI